MKSFGLVTIPVEIHTAIKDTAFPSTYYTPSAAHDLETVICAQLITSSLSAADLMRGYEFNKGEYVQVTDAELDALKNGASNLCTGMAE